MLDDDLAGLEKDFQRDFAVIMPLNMLCTKLFERDHNLWQKRGLISECDHEEGIGLSVVIG